MKTMYLYIVKCRDSSYYTGVTNDIEKRIYEHNSGADPECYTFKRRPVLLVFCEMFDDPLQAIEREKQVKGWSRRKKEALINKNWEALTEYSRCLNETSHANLAAPRLRSG